MSEDQECFGFDDVPEVLTYGRMAREIDLLMDYLQQVRREIGAASRLAQRGDPEAPVSAADFVGFFTEAEELSVTLAGRVDELRALTQLFVRR